MSDETKKELEKQLELHRREKEREEAPVSGAFDSWEALRVKEDAEFDAKCFFHRYFGGDVDDIDDYKVAPEHAVSFGMMAAMLEISAEIRLLRWRVERLDSYQE